MKLTEKQKEFMVELYENFHSCKEIEKEFKNKYKKKIKSDQIKELLSQHYAELIKYQGPKVLVFDIETAPIEAYVWGLWNNNVGLNQIISDWFVLSWAAKWLHEDNVMYQDNRKVTKLNDFRNRERLEKDKVILEKIWHLLDEADIVITQNGKKFDQRKLNARFIINGMQPPSTYKHIDTKEIASKKFGFTSNKLAYMTDKLCKKFKKSKHAKFSGQELWTECLRGNPEAWKEMEHYNRYDVLSLEELWTKLMPWDNTVNFNLYTDSTTHVCHCGSTEFRKRGYHYTANSKFQRYKCKKCGTESRGKENLFSKEKRKSLRQRTY